MGPIAYDETIRCREPRGSCQCLSRHVEASLVIRPYLPTMTRSELFTVMNLGMATVAGSVLLAYVQILGGGDFAGHLVTASLLSAPAGFLIAKVMVPEMETPESGRGAHADVEQETVNVIDAAATGAINGLRLAAYVGAMLIAFVALIALLNDSLQAVGSWAGLPGLTFQRILGWIMAPVAWVMGIPGQDVVQVGGLLGVKTVLNEFIAYQELGRLASQGALQPRSILIASYALCGFANFGSLAILLGGIGGVAPSRRSDVAQLGLRSILGGSLTTFMDGLYRWRSVLDLRLSIRTKSQANGSELEINEALPGTRTKHVDQ